MASENLNRLGPLGAAVDASAAGPDCAGRGEQAGVPPGARAHLLDTASAIMRERDTVDVSLSELSRRAGLNSALVKYYFGNKAGLLKALLERGNNKFFVDKYAVQNLAARDQRDSQRAAAPLMVALGARVINNSQMTSEQTSSMILADIRERLAELEKIAANRQKAGMA